MPKKTKPIVLADDPVLIDRLTQMALMLSPLSAEKIAALATRSKEHQYRARMMEDLIALLLVEVAVREMLYFSLVSLWSITDPDFLDDYQIETIEETLRLAAQYREARSQ